MEKIQNFFENRLGPVMKKMSTNKYIQALANGFMLIVPVTLGVAVLAVLGNLPIPFWQSFLQKTGLYQVVQDFISLTMALTAIYLVGAIAYRYTQNVRGKDGMITAVIALASFMALMPIQTDKVGTTTLLMSNLGSNGIFVSMIIGLAVGSLYCSLMEKKITIKMPASVPPNVADSLAPTFVVMIIFMIIFILKYVFILTPFGNVFDFISAVVQRPVMHIAASAGGLLLFELFATLLWFFGVHPNTLNSVLWPILMAAGTANIEAYVAGKELPYLAMSILYPLLTIGGQGNTLGLCLSTLTAKSDKYKTMRKLVIPANIFNINEPIIFGFPLMLNPIYFIPMLLTTLLSGVIGIAYINVIGINFNPSVSLPWVTPGFVSTFMSGGISYLILWILVVAIHTVVYLPFFKIDDNKTLKEEKKLLNQ